MMSDGKYFIGKTNYFHCFYVSQSLSLAKIKTNIMINETDGNEINGKLGINP